MYTKPITACIAGLLVVLSMATTSQAQVADWNLLNPFDDQGRPWYETLNDRTNFFNGMIAEVKTSKGGSYVSLRDDVFICSVRIDNNVQYGGQRYHNVYAFKGGSTDVDQLNIGENNPHHYQFHYYIGSKMNHANVRVTARLFSGYWYSELKSAVVSSTLTSQPEGSIRNAWIEHAALRSGILDQIRIEGR